MENPEKILLSIRAQFLCGTTGYTPSLFYQLKERKNKGRFNFLLTQRREFVSQFKRIISVVSELRSQQKLVLEYTKHFFCHVIHINSQWKNFGSSIRVYYSIFFDG